jgi:hypothetical protein
MGAHGPARGEGCAPRRQVRCARVMHRCSRVLGELRRRRRFSVPNCSLGGAESVEAYRYVETGRKLGNVVVSVAPWNS